MPEEIKKELEYGRKEAAAGREGNLKLTGSYLLAERMADIKADLGGIKQDIGGLRQEVKEEIGRLDSKIDSQVGSLRQEIGGLRQEIGRLDSKIDSQIGGLRQETREDFRHLDGKLDSAVWWARSIFFGMLIGTAAIVVAIISLR